MAHVEAELATKTDLKALELALKADLREADDAPTIGAIHEDHILLVKSYGLLAHR